MIKIKRIYEPIAAADGRRILVDRLWPRGVSKTKAGVTLWTREVAPSDKLRKWFGHEPEKWPEFRRRYRAELKLKSAELDRISAEAGKSDVTLLFAAKDEQRNNAVVLREYLDKRRKKP